MFDIVQKMDRKKLIFPMNQLATFCDTLTEFISCTTLALVHNLAIIITFVWHHQSSCMIHTYVKIVNMIECSMSNGNKTVNNTLMYL